MAEMVFLWKKGKPQAKMSSLLVLISRGFLEKNDLVGWK